MSPKNQGKTWITPEVRRELYTSFASSHVLYLRWIDLGMLVTQYDTSLLDIVNEMKATRY